MSRIKNFFSKLFLILKHKKGNELMEDITVEELKEKIDNKEDFVFVDVREQHEYDTFNLGAELIPLGTLMSSLDKLDPHKNDEIVIHCRSGKRSGAAKQALEQLGYTKVRNLLGGVLDWQAKFPD